MKHRICSVGRTRGWAGEAVQEFEKRIQGYGGIELCWVEDGKRTEEKLLEKGRGWWRVCLDPQGQGGSTGEWRREWEDWEKIGRTKIAWMIGGADGHSESLRKRCDVVRSLGGLTLSHDLALVVLLEQIYRLESWRAGHPYHRA